MNTLNDFMEYVVKNSKPQDKLIILNEIGKFTKSFNEALSESQSDRKHSKAKEFCPKCGNELSYVDATNVYVCTYCHLYVGQID